MENFLKDLRYSLRMFGKNRAFTFAAVAALALGIGATTSVFSVVSAVLLRPFPFPEPERVVLFMNTSPQGTGVAASPAKFVHWRRQADVVQDVSAFRSGIVNYTGSDTPQQLNSGQVSADFFRLYGAQMALGRTFSAEEDLPNGPRVVDLSYGFWTRRFGADPQVLGKTILLSGDPYQVIGVIGRDFDADDIGVRSPDVWMPFQIDPNSTDQGHYFQAAGRIKAGVSLAQAQAKIKQSAEEFRAKFPVALPKAAGFNVEPLEEVFLRNSRSLLVILLAAVTGVLLIACANVANLLLIRATVRRREIAIRSAIGADRSRIVRQLLTESVVLSTVGGALGLALGLLGIKALLSINTAELPRVGDGGSLVHMDWRVMAFTAVVSIATGLLFGVAPALHASRGDLSAALKEGAGPSGAGARNSYGRSALVVLEVTLALTLVIGSALLIRTSLSLRAVQPGFDSNNVLTMSMSFTAPQFAPTAGVEQAVHDGIARLNALPGVEIASAACCIPLEGGYGLPFAIVGRPLDPGPFHGGAAWTTVSPGYFEVFKIPALSGRTFNDRDNAGGTPVVIINESMAKQYWKTGSPLNDRLAIGRGGMREFASEPDRQIIGVVADSRDGGLNQDPGPKMFIPQAQVTDLANALNVRLSPMKWVIRTKVAPMSVSAAAREQLRLATGLPVADVRTMGEVVSRSTSREQFNMLLMTVFAISALTLAAIGIYGVMAYSVEQRTREIGIRLALGQRSGAVRTMVVMQGMGLAAIGVAAGVATSFALSRFMSGMLFGVQARDPLVFVGVPVLLGVVAFLAVWIPAARASKVDPLIAMRS